LSYKVIIKEIAVRNRLTISDVARMLITDGGPTASEGGESCLGRKNNTPIG